MAKTLSPSPRERRLWTPQQDRENLKETLVLKLLCIGLAILLGLGAAANGAFMLVSPERWYFAVPGVTTTGPFNQHFIRDIGLIFLLLGAGLLTGAARPRLRSLLWTATAVWLSGHALFHFWEVAVGICSASAIPRDFPAVTLPAILTSLLAVWAFREGRRT
jgi:hypothetical protein